MSDSGACCSPRRNLSSGGAKNQSRSPRLGGIEPPYGWALIPDGEFWMGNDRSPYPGDGEGPRRRVWLDSYQLSVTTVTNSEFQRFVNATGYVTDAEKYGWSFVFEGLLLPGEKPELLDSEVSGAPWWRQSRAPVGKNLSEIHGIKLLWLITRLFIFLTTMLKHFATGHRFDCLLRRSGSVLPEVDTKTSIIHGAGN